jgi:hypothetical protein
MDPRYSYFADNLILLNENVSSNGKYKRIFYQIHTGGKIVNRNNISFRPISRILSEYRDINSKILFALSDLQIVRDIRNNRNESNDNNDYKKSLPLIRRSAFIISLVSCEEERANIDRAN